jgi:hypothetical protein
VTDGERLRQDRELGTVTALEDDALDVQHDQLALDRAEHGAEKVGEVALAEVLLNRQTARIALIEEGHIVGALEEERLRELGVEVVNKRLAGDLEPLFAHLLAVFVGIFARALVGLLPTHHVRLPLVHFIVVRVDHSRRPGRRWRGRRGRSRRT